MKIGFAGLGVMGAPMARHLVQAGHDVAGFNRTPAKARLWAEATGGRFAGSVAEAAAGADLFILCVGNDDDVREVVTEALPHLSPGAVIVDHTTTSAKLAREMATLAAGQGRRFIDAPVSGGQAGAENGQLSVMAGGEAGALAAVKPALMAYSKAVKHMGPEGSGQLTKMVNQIAIAGVVQGLAEAVH
ncbi:MAG TPA: NAD(P)-dependent oxidoreductase, partial [Brevundimonas sp.]|nr:NAD(P)-dependent oxidoreductase [Brevundimonas sp.]